ncbi:hypothetical protein [Streptomyces sp. NPDC058613]|uniref:hypothetical protein n=1 Tax=unclassified Streptomyces TaxID=2593676 RepID=UPI003656C385
MELPTTAAPGVGPRADAAADAACHLYDAVAPRGADGPAGWSRTAAEDAAEAIETTAHALAHIGPGAEVVLAPVHAALADLRRRLGLPPADVLSDGGLPVPPRTVGNPRRTRRVRGLTPPSPRPPPSRTTS